MWKEKAEVKRINAIQPNGLPQQWKTSNSYIFTILNCVLQ